MGRNQFCLAGRYKTVVFFATDFDLATRSVPPDSAIQSVASARRRDISSGGLS
jgi:hypothetical protein